MGRLETKSPDISETVVRFGFCCYCATKTTGDHSGTIRESARLFFDEFGEHFTRPCCEKLRQIEQEFRDVFGVPVEFGDVIRWVSSVVENLPADGKEPGA